MKKRFFAFGTIVGFALLLTHIFAEYTAPHFPVESEEVVMQIEQKTPQGGNIRFQHKIQTTKPQESPISNRPRMVTFSLLLICAISASASLAVHYYKQETIRKSFESEKLTGELQFLKSQINPHFLFNVLNNMYGLSLKKSDLLPDSILKLSGMMRYMLYESEDKEVPLKNEISYLDSFIDLQKLRLANRIDISFLKEGAIDDKRISPMILIPFVENAFKHGITHNGNSYIFIYLKIDGDTMIFKTDNPFTGHKAKDKASGVGVQNVQRRLALLYPQRHSLKKEIQDDRYICTLVVQLHGSKQIESV